MCPLIVCARCICMYAAEDHLWSKKVESGQINEYCESAEAFGSVNVACVWAKYDTTINIVLIKININIYWYIYSREYGLLNNRFVMKLPNFFGRCKLFLGYVRFFFFLHFKFPFSIVSTQIISYIIILYSTLYIFYLLNFLFLHVASWPLCCSGNYTWKWKLFWPSHLYQLQITQNAFKIIKYN